MRPSNQPGISVKQVRWRLGKANCGGRRVRAHPYPEAQALLPQLSFISPTSQGRALWRHEKQRAAHDFWKPEQKLLIAPACGAEKHLHQEHPTQSLAAALHLSATSPACPHAPTPCPKLLCTSPSFSVAHRQVLPQASRAMLHHLWAFSHPQPCHTWLYHMETLLPPH